VGGAKGPDTEYGFPSTAFGSTRGHCESNKSLQFNNLFHHLNPMLLYKAQPVKRLWIPKPNGEKRPVGSLYSITTSLLQPSPETDAEARMGCSA
jgi:hypothetical protein